jgi:hypothetical protein
MPPKMTKDKIRKLKDSQSSEDNKITTTEKNETTAKAVSYDIKSGNYISWDNRYTGDSGCCSMV